MQPGRLRQHADPSAKVHKAEVAAPKGRPDAVISRRTRHVWWCLRSSELEATGSLISPSTALFTRRHPYAPTMLRANPQRPVVLTCPRNTLPTVPVNHIAAQMSRTNMVQTENSGKIKQRELVTFQRSLCPFCSSFPRKRESTSQSARQIAWVNCAN